VAEGQLDTDPVRLPTLAVTPLELLTEADMEEV
jgi:hypothetical protein